MHEAHTLCMVGHFGVDKIIGNLLHYAFWPCLQADVESLFIVVSCVVRVSLAIGSWGCTNHSLYLRCLGKVSPCILLEFFKGSSMGIGYIFVILNSFQQNEGADI